MCVRNLDQGESQEVPDGVLYSSVKISVALKDTTSNKFCPLQAVTLQTYFISRFVHKFQNLGYLFKQLQNDKMTITN